MKSIAYFLLAIMTSPLFAQVQVGGGCDGCELMYIDMPSNIQSSSYSPAYHENNSGNLLIKGKVFHRDGMSPAKNIIVYYWHTDETGYYTSKEQQTQDAKRHGYIRGWVKSDEKGNYSIYTIIPKAYPKLNTPAHIHLSIKEPTIADEYYVDSLVFDYDPLVTTKYRKKSKNRGGSGILRSLISKNMIIAEHNIILGLNIPNYPATTAGLNSGLNVGEDFHSISPHHAWGPDKGTTTCPVCRYGRYLGVMYFVTSLKGESIRKWLLYLEQQSVSRDRYLKVYLIYSNPEKHDFEKRNTELTELGKELKLEKVALTSVPSFNDKKSDIHLLKINPQATNTFLIYRNRNIIGKFVDSEPNKENFEKLNSLLGNYSNAFFQLLIDKTQR